MRLTTKLSMTSPTVERWLDLQTRMEASSTAPNCTFCKTDLTRASLWEGARPGHPLSSRGFFVVSFFAFLSRASFLSFFVSVFFFLSATSAGLWVSGCLDLQVRPASDCVFFSFFSFLSFFSFPFFSFFSCAVFPFSRTVSKGRA